jgi:hypothetical protein
MAELTEADNRDYLMDWSARIAEAISTDELKLLVDEYRAIARNRNLSDTDRSIARKRALWLNRHLQKSK